MPKFTVENLLDKISDRMKIELQYQIDALNQLNDDFDLDSIDEAAWIAGSLDERVANFPDCCFYFIDDYQSIVNGPQVVSSISIEFDLIVSYREDGNDYRRLLRYQQALMDAASEVWGKVGKGYDRATITALNPIDVKLFNNSYYSKVIGLRFEFNLVN